MSKSSKDKAAPVVKEYVYACTLADFGEKLSHRVKVGDKTMLLLRKQGTGQIFAIDNKCPHRGYPLHKSEAIEIIDGALCITCPAHSLKLNVETGLGLDSTKKQKRYRVEIRESEVWVRP